TPHNRQTRLALHTTAALFLIGVVACGVRQSMDLQALGSRKGESWTAGFGRLFPRIVVTASVSSLNARTAGLAIYPVYSFPRAMAFFVMLLMMIGASPSGTGGGLKTTTIYELLTGPVRVLRGRPVSRTFGIAAVWLGLYLAAVVFFQVMLLWAEPQMPGDRLLFVTVSALSNVGLTHDVLSMTRSSLLLVSAAMFFGRITPLLILWWMADTTRDADVLVG
ncbi:MAG TPA: potassium transporter TrkG, partial [Tepidisphaeraceae bacterium]